MNKEDCRGILLAAGLSRRFGSDKLLHPLPDGTPMAIACALRLRDALPATLVVVAKSNTALIDQLEAHGIDTLGIDSTGMGESLAAGIMASTGAAGWVVALADMPWLRAETIQSVSAALAAGAVLAAPSYRGRRGHPVGFSKQFYGELSRIDGDEGARHLIARNLDRLLLIECDDPGSLRDVDTPADMKRLA